jgi:pimeloyl-ACP methyl ester carboxylesterase
MFVGLHGWSGSGRSFDPLAPFLPEDVSLFAVEQPGFGSTPGPARWDVEHLVGPVVAALERLPSGPLTLVGHCAGAIVALHAALRLPARIDRVVLIDPFSYAPWYFSVFDWPVLGALFYGFTFANPIGRWLTNRSLSRVRQPGMDLIEGFRTVRHVDNWRYLRALVRSAREGFRVFAPYSGRVDILYGQRTFSAVRRSLDDWRSLWPDLIEVELAGAGHMPIHEAPGAVSDAVFGSATAPAGQLEEGGRPWRRR